MKRFLYAGDKVLYAGPEPLFVIVADVPTGQPVGADDDMFVANVPPGNSDYLFRQATSDGFHLGVVVFISGGGQIQAALNDGPWSTFAAFNADMDALGKPAQDAGFTFSFKVIPADITLGCVAEIELNYLNG